MKTALGKLIICTHVLQKGFPKKDLLTPEAKAAWMKWKESEDQKKPEINSENLLLQNETLMIS